MSQRGPVSAVWANDGGDKVGREELRAKTGCRKIVNRLWDGKQISLFGARNEIVSVNIVLEAARNTAVGVSVSITSLEGSAAQIVSKPRSVDGLFDWTATDIELFYVRYLPIRGLSAVSYATYDERHVPQRFQRPIDASGEATGSWSDRADHDLAYPDIAVPIELHPTFTIEAGSNQSIWADIYIPKGTPPGVYRGTVHIKQGKDVLFQLPIVLDVLGFELPDEPAAHAMVATSYESVSQRYAGPGYHAAGSKADRTTRQVMDRQMALAHRHLVDLIDDNGGASDWKGDEPRPEWLPRLTGELFTRKNGYRGPGEGVGAGVFSIGTYGLWQQWWDTSSPGDVKARASRWEAWFQKHAPTTDRFLYLSDEAEDLTQTETWAKWAREGRDAGSRLPTFATLPLTEAARKAPSVDIACSAFQVGLRDAWQAAADQTRNAGPNRLCLYNGFRPASGSFAIEDDGVALRELVWGQTKLGIDRWFFWHATYYDDYQGGRGPTNVYEDAQTFGGPTQTDPILGQTGWNASNGDGVLLYPGTDAIFADHSYGVAGPFASLRLKHWRRGIQDAAYLKLAASRDPDAVRALVERMVPKVLWEVGVSDVADPTWVKAPISWSTDPDDWEEARAELAGLIKGKSPSAY